MESIASSRPNGAALAAFLAAGCGAAAMACLVLLDQADVFAAPGLYPPAGGVSGRTTFAVLAWLAAWVFLHRGWRDRHVAPGRVLPLAVALVVLGILGCLPPVWGLF